MSDWHHAGSLSMLRQMGGSVALSLAGRAVAIFEDRRAGAEAVYAIDEHCYHAGGPLHKAHGDIEDILNEPCIRCPLHNYIISLKSGHSFYQPCTFEKTPEGKLKPIVGDWTSKGVKQRVHEVKLEGEQIMVRLVLNEPEKEVDADKFAAMPIKH
uniref:Rieske domain-containing protein n=1 Tax=Chromera velia CCMP2878 TaxID=1169474 RepID=A0A0G4HFE0_9ALVE|eukprot:Cvel_27007.t1-p1 / transcript=Cvel_27007.t1 / gene=Cvel_27007 / organism=Chromera_velia_CCMP2878 / gene_product=Rieske domain-containing protein, putative / transcript_product=Rieske domain-containing protein, putative / location=Cvel_scaffold3301:3686-8415(-) / protein_length=154 / sequence_SO=supercontig / SO=protein_coding / is_pseudo=false